MDFADLLSPFDYPRQSAANLTRGVRNLFSGDATTNDLIGMAPAVAGGLVGGMTMSPLLGALAAGAAQGIGKMTGHQAFNAPTTGDVVEAFGGDRNSFLQNFGAQIATDPLTFATASVVPAGMARSSPFSNFYKATAYADKVDALRGLHPEQLSAEARGAVGALNDIGEEFKFAGPLTNEEMVLTRANLLDDIGALNQGYYEATGRGNEYYRLLNSMSDQERNALFNAAQARKLDNFFSAKTISNSVGSKPLYSEELASQLNKLPEPFAKFHFNRTSPFVSSSIESYLSSYPAIYVDKILDSANNPLPLLASPNSQYPILYDALRLDGNFLHPNQMTDFINQARLGGFPVTTDKNAINNFIQSYREFSNNFRPRNSLNIPRPIADIDFLLRSISRDPNFMVFGYGKAFPNKQVGDDLVQLINKINQLDGNGMPSYQPQNILPHMDGLPNYLQAAWLGEQVGKMPGLETIMNLGR
jgi:hypothetical protein